LVSHLGQLDYHLLAGIMSRKDATVRYALHRKEYKSLPTDKAG
jgi:hypothetical protein